MSAPVETMTIEVTLPVNVVRKAQHIKWVPNDARTAFAEAVFDAELPKVRKPVTRNTPNGTRISREGLDDRLPYYFIGSHPQRPGVFVCLEPRPDGLPDGFAIGRFDDPWYEVEA